MTTIQTRSEQRGEVSQQSKVMTHIPELDFISSTHSNACLVATDSVKKQNAIGSACWVLCVLVAFALYHQLPKVEAHIIAQCVLNRCQLLHVKPVQHKSRRQMGA